MRFVDTPVPRLANRTAREAFIIGSMLACCVSALLAPHIQWWDFAVFVLATTAFITRFWAARVLAIGTCISALCMAAVHFHAGRWELDSLSFNAYYFVGTWVLGVAVLWSRDLRQQFERAPGFGPFANPFASLPDAHLRALTACSIAFGSAGHMLLRHYQLTGDSSLLVQMGAIAACLALLIFGRAISFVATVVVGAWVSYTFGCVAMSGAGTSIAVVGLPLSAAGTAIALPYAARAVRHAVR